MGRQQRERPRQGVGGGLVPGQQEGEHLVLDVLSAHPLAGLLVDRAQQQRQQVVAGRLPGAFADQARDHRTGRCHGRAHLRHQPGRPLAGPSADQAPDAGQRLAAGHRGPDRAHVGVRQRDVEHGPGEDVQGHLGQRRGQVEPGDPGTGGLAGPGGPDDPGRAQPLGLLGHPPGVRRHRVVRERRLHQAALPGVVRAAAGQQAVAHGQRQRGARLRRRGVVGQPLGEVAVVRQHVLDLGRSADDVHRPPAEPEASHRTGGHGAAQQQRRRVERERRQVPGDPARSAPPLRPPGAAHGRRYDTWTTTCPGASPATP